MDDQKKIFHQLFPVVFHCWYHFSLFYGYDEATELKETIENYVKTFFPQAEIAYFT